MRFGAPRGAFGRRRSCRLTRLRFFAKSQGARNQCGKNSHPASRSFAIFRATKSFPFKMTSLTMLDDRLALDRSAGRQASHRCAGGLDRRVSAPSGNATTAVLRCVAVHRVVAGKCSQTHCAGLRPSRSIVNTPIDARAERPTLVLHARCDQQTCDAAAASLGVPHGQLRVKMT